MSIVLSICLALLCAWTTVSQRPFFETTAFPGDSGSSFTQTAGSPSQQDFPFSQDNTDPQTNSGPQNNVFSSLSPSDPNNDSRFNPSNFLSSQNNDLTTQSTFPGPQNNAFPSNPSNFPTPQGNEVLNTQPTFPGSQNNVFPSNPSFPTNFRNNDFLASGSNFPNSQNNDFPSNPSNFPTPPQNNDFFASQSNFPNSQNNDFPSNPPVFPAPPANDISTTQPNFPRSQNNVFPSSPSNFPTPQNNDFLTTQSTFVSSQNNAFPSNPSNFPNSQSDSFSTNPSTFQGIQNNAFPSNPSNFPSSQGNILTTIQPNFPNSPNNGISSFQTNIPSTQNNIFSTTQSIPTSSQNIAFPSFPQNIPPPQNGVTFSTQPSFPNQQNNGPSSFQPNSPISQNDAFSTTQANFLSRQNNVQQNNGFGFQNSGNLQTQNAETFAETVTQSPLSSTMPTQFNFPSSTEASVMTSLSNTTTVQWDPSQPAFAQPTGPAFQPTGPAPQPTGPAPQPTGPASQPTVMQLVLASMLTGQYSNEDQYIGDIANNASGINKHALIELTYVPVFIRALAPAVTFYYEQYINNGSIPSRKAIYAFIQETPCLIRMSTYDVTNTTRFSATTEGLQAVEQFMPTDSPTRPQCDAFWELEGDEKFTSYLATNKCTFQVSGVTVIPIGSRNLTCPGMTFTEMWRRAVDGQIVGGSPMPYIFKKTGNLYPVPVNVFSPYSCFREPCKGLGQPKGPTWGDIQPQMSYSRNGGTSSRANTF